MHSWIMLGLATFLLYPIGMRLLAELAHPMRLDMAQHGLHLLAHPQCSSAWTPCIQRMLDTAFSPVPAAWMVLWTPVHVLGQGLNTSRRPHTDNHDLNDRMDTFARQHLVSVMAANPIAGVLILGEFLLLAPIVMLAPVLHGRPVRGVAAASNTFAQADVHFHKSPRYFLLPQVKAVPQP